MKVNCVLGAGSCEKDVSVLETESGLGFSTKIRKYFTIQFTCI